MMKKVKEWLEAVGAAFLLLLGLILFYVVFLIYCVVKRKWPNSTNRDEFYESVFGKDEDWDEYE